MVKTDGLAAGKGAIVCRTLDEADSAIRLCLEDGAFGEAGRTVVVEEFMEGEEASFFVVTDGTSALPFQAAQDHKTIFDGDRGPNTGGMGAYSPAPVMDATTERRVMDEIVMPTIAAMAKEGAPYAGVLYIGLMISREGPRVVEFNCRFGDPECQAIVPRLEDDLLPVFDAVARGRGLPPSLRWRAESSVCVVLASRLSSQDAGGRYDRHASGPPRRCRRQRLRTGGQPRGRPRHPGGRALACRRSASRYRGHRAPTGSRIASASTAQWRRDIGRRALVRS